MPKLVFSLNKYVLERYGGWKPLLVRYLLIKLVMKLVRLILLEINEQKDVDSTQKIITDEKEKLSRREKLKIHLRKVFSKRGGALPSPGVILQIVQTLLDSQQVLTGLILLLQGLKFEDLQVARITSVYDLYMDPPYELRSGEKGICESGESPFGYLFMILSDDKIPLSRKEQVDEIYDQLFKYDKLKQYAKNHKNIVMFLTCAFVFILQFKQANSGVTVDSFYKALIKALREEKISKAVAKKLLLKLDKNKYELPAELKELITA